MTVPPPSAPSSRTRQARLDGPSQPLDRRTHAVRDDLADVELAACVIAPRYATAVPLRCVVPHAALVARPDVGEPTVSQLLFGETFDVLDIARGWMWGRCRHDRYVGWLPAAALASVCSAPTHRVTAVTAIIFTAPDIKAAVAMTLPLGGLLALEPAGPAFFRLGERQFIHARHVEPLSAPPHDALTVAATFVGAPYGWGGRTAAGIDCSGLTQIALMAAGIACPRDTDQQQAGFAAVPFASRQRGDLVFFPGHVGLLVDADTLLHANAFWMATVVEPLAAVVARPGAAHPLPILGIACPAAAHNDVASDPC